MVRFLVIVFTVFLLLPSNAFASEGTEDVKAEIEKIKGEEVSFLLNEITKQKNKSEKEDYLKNIGIYADSVVDNHEKLKSIIKKKIDDSYIFFMDDDGTVYDKHANVFTSLDIKNYTVSGKADKANSEVSVLAYQNPRINGDSTGAFIRQTSVEGYIGSNVTYTLPPF